MFIKNFKKNIEGQLLLSLLVSLGIIALLATISIPYLKKYQPNLKLNGTARDMVSDLRLTQQLTVTEQVAHQVFFDVTNDCYQIIKTGTPDVVIKSVSMDSDISFQQVTGLTDNKVIFNYYGSVSESGQVILVNINSKIANINIKPSGYVQISQ
jgi:Tfp pilus assembly protein FimT